MARPQPAAGFVDQELAQALDEYSFGLRMPPTVWRPSPTAEPALPRISLALLEGVDLVVSVSNAGFTIIQVDPASAEDHSLAEARPFNADPYLLKTFESLDALLNEASPLFRGRFQQRLFARLAEIQDEQSDGSDGSDGDRDRP
ncbi:uncharacterized protein BJ171DRAFT_503968 [Polychytrium aggregatum]|uniref:uncharacterized protein n=1 Tax=Polychytrium aggregatum TaxID=110093 RepID=UPI0022FE2462|nr:uncharacterized protein BJ171DRAFT_503968 [Polychytrium aggregatum]KAI9204894.1 hypothetical protein BJ171DRAFT_503968 [Polychytrium aggregatum]